MAGGNVIAACFILGATTALASNAGAQSKLPWADANPLENGASHRPKPRVKPAPKPNAAATSAPAPVLPAAAAPAPAPSVPTPDPRPAKPGDATQAAEPRSAASSASGGESPAAAAEPTPGNADKALADDTPTPVPGQPDALQPVPAENKPVAKIPIPDQRPATAPQQSEALPATDAPVQGKAAGEPPKPDDAPNSTDKLKSREPTIDPATSVVAAAAIEDAKECEAELKKRGADFVVGESISEGECGVLRPVDIKTLSSGVEVGPKTQMLCRSALALDVWMSDVVVPAAKANFPDDTLTRFQQASTYVCRPRASERGISEHARGSAIDIGSFVFAKGREIGVAAQTENSPEAKFEAAVRSGACGPFKTVLGPGTDPDHATHFHLDIAARKNGATYCK